MPRGKQLMLGCVHHKTYLIFMKKIQINSATYYDPTKHYSKEETDTKLENKQNLPIPLTTAEYVALETKEPNQLYIIVKQH